MTDEAILHIPQTYVRHQGPVGSDRVFDGPGNAVGAWCLACDAPIEADQRVVLVPVGCDSEEDREKLKTGRWVTAKALMVHADCAGR